MIPKRIIQTWFGSLPPPRAEMQTWRDHHPDWEVVVVDRMTGWKNQPAFDAMRELNGKSDIARYELLEELGGIYVDADSVCLRPLDDRFLTPEAWATFEHETERPGIITGAFMGSVAGGALVADLVADLQSLPAGELRAGFDVTAPAWESVGPVYLTRLAQRYIPQRLSVFPSRYFSPEHYTGKLAPLPTHRPFVGCIGGDKNAPIVGTISIGKDEALDLPFARHFWGNTATTGGYVKILGAAAIVTSHEQSATLARAIWSVLAQSLPVREVIVVCGDSASFHVASNVAAHVDDDIRFEVVSRWNRCPDRQVLREEGVQWPHSPFMFILDGDDELAPTWLEDVATIVHGDRVIAGVATSKVALFTKNVWADWSRTPQTLLSQAPKEIAR